MGHATFRVGDLTAVIGDNAADGNHRAGYNGLWSLTHTAEPTSLFVPIVAGLNPAWDFQYLIPGYEVSKEYAFRARLAYRPRCSRTEILQEVASWRRSLNFS